MFFKMVSFSRSPGFRSHVRQNLFSLRVNTIVSFRSTRKEIKIWHVHIQKLQNMNFRVNFHVIFF